MEPDDATLDVGLEDADKIDAVGGWDRAIDPGIVVPGSMGRSR